MSLPYPPSGGRGRRVRLSAVDLGRGLRRPPRGLRGRGRPMLSPPAREAIVGDHRWALLEAGAEGAEARGRGRVAIARACRRGAGRAEPSRRGGHHYRAPAGARGARRPATWRVLSQSGNLGARPRGPAGRTRLERLLVRLARQPGGPRPRRLPERLRGPRWGLGRWPSTSEDVVDGRAFLRRLGRCAPPASRWSLLAPGRTEAAVAQCRLPTPARSPRRRWWRRRRVRRVGAVRVDHPTEMADLLAALRGTAAARRSVDRDPHRRRRPRSSRPADALVAAGPAGPGAHRRAHGSTSGWRCGRRRP